jgi:hypothetical protein
MKMQGVTMWEMNLGFRPKDFQSVWGAIIQKNSLWLPRDLRSKVNPGHR